MDEWDERRLREIMAAESGDPDEHLRKFNQTAEDFASFWGISVEDARAMLRRTLIAHAEPVPIERFGVAMPRAPWHLRLRIRLLEYVISASEWIAYQIKYRRERRRGSNPDLPD